MNTENNEWRQKYEKHIRSAKWKNIRRDLFKIRGEKCESCGARSSMLEVHHLNYDRLGNELITDLKIVCKPCHVKEDEKRARQVSINRQINQYNNAFNTWFYKRTGMNPFYADDSAYEEFDRWLENKNWEPYGGY